MELYFPARYVFAFLGFTGFVMVYTMRVNLSVVIVAMVNSSTNAVTDGNTSVMACRELDYEFQNQSLSSEPKYTGEFNWDPNTQSTMLGAFFYGYVVTQIPGGIIAERWNAKWLFGLGVLITSIFTLLSPIAAQWSAQAFIAVRVIEGLAEGAMYPSINTMIGRWVSKMERSRVSTFIFSGMFVGNVAALSISGVLSESNIFAGWPSAFYLFGLLGCIWFVFWAFLIYERPDDHPRISESELSYIKKDQMNKIDMDVPWIAILTSTQLWAVSVAHFGQDWGFYTMMTEMPTYLANILHFDVEKNGILSSLPYILQTVVSWTAGYLADKIRESGRYSITTIRKLFNSIGFFGCGLSILLVAFIGCRPIISVALLCVALGFHGIAYSGFKVTHVDMSPRFAGILMGITSTVGNCSGFLAPFTVGKLISTGETLRNWGIVFGITSGIFFVSGIVFIIFASAELQQWGAPSDLTINSSDSEKNSLQLKVQNST